MYVVNPFTIDVMQLEGSVVDKTLMTSLVKISKYVLCA